MSVAGCRWLLMCESSSLRAGEEGGGVWNLCQDVISESDQAAALSRSRWTAPRSVTQQCRSHSAAYVELSFSRVRLRRRLTQGLPGASPSTFAVASG